MKAGQKLAVLSAMKMETAVQSPCDGLVRHVGVDKGDSLEAGEWFCTLTAFSSCWKCYVPKGAPADADVNALPLASHC